MKKIISNHLIRFYLSLFLVGLVSSYAQCILGLRFASRFVVYTAGRFVTNTSIYTIYGDIETDLDAMTVFITALVKGSCHNGDTPALNSSYSNINTSATFSIYQGGVFIPNSVR
jgi:hypothetical protein